MLTGFYQFNPSFGRVRRNLNQVIRALEQVHADLIVLPELPFTGYFFRDRGEALQLAEEVGNSPVIDSLHAWCRARDCYLVSGFAEKYRDRCFNSAVLIGPGGLLHVYRKLHLFGTEKQYFDPGDIPLAVHTVRDVPIGIMVCYDWAFPEVCRSLALMGAALICHPSNLVLPLCQTVMRTRCLENRVFAVTANRIGTDRRPQGEIRFTGRSQITAPDGTPVWRAPAQRRQVHIEDIDPALAGSKLITPRDDLFADRRPEYYRAVVETARPGVENEK